MSDFPVCARCRKPVDMIERTDDHVCGLIRFTVFCHGEREKVEIRYMMLAPGARFIAGEAFT